MNDLGVSNGILQVDINGNRVIYYDKMKWRQVTRLAINYTACTVHPFIDSHRLTIVTFVQSQGFANRLLFVCDVVWRK